MKDKNFVYPKLKLDIMISVYIFSEFDFVPWNLKIIIQNSLSIFEFLVEIVVKSQTFFEFQAFFSRIFDGRQKKKKMCFVFVFFVGVRGRSPRKKFQTLSLDPPYDFPKFSRRGGDPAGILRIYELILSQKYDFWKSL